MLRSIAYGGVIGAVLAIAKGLVHFTSGRTDSGPITSVIVNILQQLLDQATAGWELLSTGFSGLYSFTISLWSIDMLCFVANILVFFSLISLIARQEQMAGHMEGVAARFGGRGA